MSGFLARSRRTFYKSLLQCIPGGLTFPALKFWMLIKFDFSSKTAFLLWSSHSQPLFWKKRPRACADVLHACWEGMEGEARDQMCWRKRTLDEIGIDAQARYPKTAEWCVRNLGSRPRNSRLRACIKNSNGNEGSLWPSRNSTKYRADDLCGNLICEYFCWMLGDPHLFFRQIASFSDSFHYIKKTKKICVSEVLIISRILFQ